MIYIQEIINYILSYSFSLFLGNRFFKNRIMFIIKN